MVDVTNHVFRNFYKETKEKQNKNIDQYKPIPELLTIQSIYNFNLALVFCIQ